jgi:hypothetical protein
MIQTILLPFTQMLWEAVAPHYLELKSICIDDARALYCKLLVLVLLVGFIVGGIGQYILLSIASSEAENILFGFFWVCYLIKSISVLNNHILILEGEFAPQYISEIIVSMGVCIFLTSISIEYLGALGGIYASLLFIGLLYQMLIKRLIFNIRFSKGIDVEEIVRSSIKIKFGSVLYSFKDFSIVWFFRSQPEGMYSLYSLALKIAAAIHRVVNAPILSVFMLKINIELSSANLCQERVMSLIKGIQKKMLVLYFSVTSVFCMGVLFTYKFYLSASEIATFMYFYLLVMILFLVMTMFYPYYYGLIGLKKPMEILKSHIIHFICVFVVFISTNDVYFLLIGAVVGQALLGFNQRKSFLRNI